MLSGTLSSREAYDFLRVPLLRNNWGRWIWGSFIPPCRSTTVWCAVLGLLPTSDVVFGVIGPSVCPLCYSAVESLDHLFADCGFTRLVYDSVMHIFDVTLCYDFSFHYFFLQAINLAFSPLIRNIWRLTIVTLLWVIWRARNKRVHDDVLPTIGGCMVQILACVREAGSLNLGFSDGSSRDLMIIRRLRMHGSFKPPLTAMIIRWRPPDPGWYKVNVDGSVDTSPGELFGGALFRNSRGFFVAAFTRKVGWGFALEAELAMALLVVLFAHAKGWLRLWLESDSEMVARFLQAPSSVVPWRLHALWQRYLIIRESMELRVTHIYREGNQVADALAKLRFSHVWAGVWPDCIDAYLYSDLHNDYFRVIRTS